MRERQATQGTEREREREEKYKEYGRTKELKTSREREGRRHRDKT